MEHLADVSYLAFNEHAQDWLQLLQLCIGKAVEPAEDVYTIINL